MKLAILGGGAWGTALAAVWGESHALSLWARDPEQARLMAAQRVNTRYLPEVSIPDSVTVTGVLRDAVADADLVVLAMPSTGMREVLRQWKTCGRDAPLLWLCKGFEPGSVKLPHQMVSEELGTMRSCGVLSGPSFADEVGRGLPAAVILASDGCRLCRCHRARFAHPSAAHLFQHRPGGRGGGRRGEERHRHRRRDL